MVALIGRRSRRQDDRGRGDEAIDMKQTRGRQATMPAEEMVWGTMAAEPKLVIESRTDADGRAVIDLRGELDVAEIERLYQQACRAIDGSSTEAIFELRRLTFCDASGLGCLVRIGNHADAVGCRMVLAEPTPTVAKILRIAQLDRRFPVIPGPTEPRPDEVEPAGSIGPGRDTMRVPRPDLGPANGSATGLTPAGRA